MSPPASAGSTGSLASAASSRSEHSRIWCAGISAEGRSRPFNADARKAAGLEAAFYTFPCL